MVVKSQVRIVAALASMAAIALTAGTQPLSAQATPAPAAAPAEAPAYTPSRTELMEFGRLIVGFVLAANVDSLVARSNAEVTAPGSVRASLVSNVAPLAGQLGVEVRVISERVVRAAGRLEYWRTAEYSEIPVNVTFRVQMGRAGKWRAFNLGATDNLPAAEDVLP